MGDTFTMSGDFRNSNINIKSTLTQVQQSVGEINSADSKSKEQLNRLILQLSQELENTPPQKKEEAEAVAASAKMLVDQAKEAKPNKTSIQITGDGLKQAAKNIADVMPTVLSIATQIVMTVVQMTNRV